MNEKSSVNVKSKIGIKLNIFNLQKYISQFNDDIEKQRRIVILIKNYNYKIKQEDVDLLKKEKWFINIFLNYASSDLIESNLNILDYYANDNIKIVIKNKAINRNLLLKIIENEKYDFKYKIAIDLLKENNFQLFKALTKNKRVVYIPHDKDILSSILKLGLNPFLNEENNHLSSFIIDNDTLDLELAKCAIKNRIIIPEFENNYLLIKMYLDNNIDIPIDKCNKFIKELYSDYREIVVKNISLLKDSIGRKIYEYEITDIDERIIKDVYPYFNFSQLLQYKSYLSSLNLNDLNNAINIFSDDNYNSQNKKYIEEIISSGFFNILHVISDKYLDKDIISLAISKGFCDISFIEKNSPSLLDSNIILYNLLKSKKEDIDYINIKKYSDKHDYISENINSMDTKYILDNIDVESSNNLSILLGNLIYYKKDDIFVKELLQYCYKEKSIDIDLVLYTYNRHINDNEENKKSEILNSSDDIISYYNLEERNIKTYK